jgi:histidine triad (HIT) family protein
MDDCIFCKIIKGDIPSNKVYEDDNVFAFLDITPVNLGHTLVIPKKHFTNIYETPEDILIHVMKAVKSISKATKTALGADGVNIIMNNDAGAGQIIMHSHVHVIPRFNNDGFSHWHGKRGYLDGEASEIAKKITQEL